MRTTSRFTDFGFSLVEATLVLGVMSLLAAAVVPPVADYVRQAETVRAKSDIRLIAVSVARFVIDVGGQRARGGWDTFQLLVSAGEVPRIGGNGDRKWLASQNSANVGLLDDQLVTNRPAYTAPAVRSLTWRGWHGPYLEAGVSADPWGHRYAVNVRALGAGRPASVIVLSAGPDGLVDTPFLGLAGVPGGDDLAALVFGTR